MDTYLIDIFMEWLKAINDKYVGCHIIPTFETQVLHEVRYVLHEFVQEHLNPLVYAGLQQSIDFIYLLPSSNGYVTLQFPHEWETWINEQMEAKEEREKEKEEHKGVVAEKMRRVYEEELF